MTEIWSPDAAPARKSNVKAWAFRYEEHEKLYKIDILFVETKQGLKQMPSFVSWTSNIM